MPRKQPDLHKKALQLSWYTLGYNVIECGASMAVGLMAGSVALIGFGLDSLIESLSAGIMIWRFNKHGKISEEEEERIEHRAEKLVGYTFLVLAGYVLYESIDKLLSRDIPEPSLFGMGIAAASIIVMPILYAVKIKTGRAMAARASSPTPRRRLPAPFYRRHCCWGWAPTIFSGSGRPTR